MGVDQNIQYWYSQIQKTDKIRTVTGSDIALIGEIPEGKITFFSRDIADNIISTLIMQPTNARCLEWLEKVRRFCEINRPNLLGVSLRRFGSKKEVRRTLEAMALLMAMGAYLHKNILLYNAAGTTADFLDGKYSRQNWLDKIAGLLVHKVLENPNYYVGKKHDI